MLPPLSKDLVLCGSGHRPSKILLDGANAYDSVVYSRLVDLAGAALEKYTPSRVISGMALGWDQALAEAAIRLQIPLYAYLPFKGQETIWPEASQERYHRILDAACGTKVCNPGGYTNWKLMARNRAMIDNSQMVLALWDGEPRGGTWAALGYAQRKKVPVVNLWPSWQKFAAATPLEVAA